MMVVDSQGNEVGKLFVGGLHQSTTNDSLKAYFSKFGDIEESIVMMDNRTGRSRGFGYITFKENSSVESVLAQKSHLVDHKEVDPKRCNVNMKGKNRRSLKVFVGGISFEHDETTIRNFFSKYGRVTEVNLLASPNKQRHRGFAFVGFDDEEVVKVLIRLHYLNMDGKKVEVKAMEPPISQRIGCSMSNQPQTNGRPVRGGRGTHFTSMQSNESYLPWNQWASVGAGGWNPFVDGGQSWTPNNAGWLNRASSATPSGDEMRTDYIPPGRFSDHHNPLVSWPDSSITSQNGWIPPGWSHQTSASSADNRIPLCGDDLSSYNTQQPQQLQMHKPRPAWESLCYTSASAPVMNPSDFFAPLESWTSNNAVYQIPLSTHADWNRQVNVPSTAAIQHWCDPGSGSDSFRNDAVGNNSFQHGIYITNSRAAPHSSDAAVAAMFAAATAATFNANTSNGTTTLPHWTSAAVAAAADLDNLKLDDTYGTRNVYGYSGQNPQVNNFITGTQNTALNGLLTNEWLSISDTAATNYPISGYQPPCSLQQQKQPQQHQQIYQR